MEGVGSGVAPLQVGGNYGRRGSTGFCMQLQAFALTVEQNSPGPSHCLYVMLLTKGSLPSLFVSGVSRQVSSMLSD